MAEYWEVNCEGLSQDTHNILNLFLRSLKEITKSPQTLTRYRATLQSFFLDHPVSYHSLTEEDIEAWLTEHRKDKKERTVKDYLKTIRAFYNFCVQEQHLDYFPLNTNLQVVSTPECYWELKIIFPNPDNQRVANQFLLHLKTIGRTEYTIVHMRTCLQRFFKEMDKSISKLTLEEIEKRMTDLQQQYNETMMKSVWSTLRTFYGYCWDKEILEDTPLRTKRKFAEATDLYWEVKGRFYVAENKAVINEFLLYLKNKKRMKKTIVEYGIILKRFFGHNPVHFSQVDRRQIDDWLSMQNQDWSTRTPTNYRAILRSFYFFCVRKNYMAQSPILYFWKENKPSEKYWETHKAFCNMTNKEVVNEYLLAMKIANMSELTIQLYRRTLETYFLQRTEDFSTVSFDEILQWVIQQQKIVQASTVNGRLSILASFFTFCVDEGYMERIPIKTRWYMREPSPLPRYLEKEELAKVRQSAEKETLRNRLIVEFLLSSGCRIRELHLLDKRDVELDNRTACVKGKGGKIREVHFSETCALLLERYWEMEAMEGEEHPALVVSRIGTRLGISRMRKIINRLGKSSGIKDSLYPHRFRHTFATELLTKGAELDFIADELGHANLQTTKIYARIPKWKLIHLYRRYMG
ncbi:tyrosine-type recombinase/integrase [Jeotgalibacillus sp. ET6]|uniref:tyrosine-type recombinase/integrase n=1 Tax=Jeotgalibacillus sp. ET6 TaxID=3037260 RepID=UPI0024181FDB|nr:tyrosine-type recombinase/integrase [Jeotgalibacillus sp. ET6]MDG5473692.1 tyrosine-type recombinase/integrase [Jeotgalibacillus sp. ET6]